MFITFEGIDGSGKTTQLNLVAQYLEKQGHEVLKIREPGGTDFSEIIRDMLLNHKTKINPISELFLFEAARADLCEKVIKPALAKNIFVLSDRFFDSTTAYQGYGRKLNIKDVERINKFATSGLKPDLTFFLDISMNLSKKRTARRPLDRMESAGEEFFERVISGFKIMAENDPRRIKVICSDDDLMNVHNKIIEIIKNSPAYLRIIS